MPPDSGFAFLAAEVRARGEATDVLIAGAILGEERKNGAIFHGEFDPDDGAKAGFFGFEEEPGRAVKAIAIEQRHRGKAATRRIFGELLGQGSAAQEAEGAAAVEFDVVGLRHVMAD